jgi:CheY-like chemotaxis protein/HPt (histidine-containing phosphotransfer) domain-containing protein
MAAALRILLVEDNPDALKFFTEILKVAGYRVDAVRDGADAIEKTTHARYDLIATDLEVPKLSGFDLIREVRAREASDGRDATPILVLTAQDRIDVRAKVLELGGTAFVAKPVRSRELVTTVRSLIDDRTAVLLVDDAEQNRAIVTAWLKQRSRVRVTCVDRAGAAIACVKRERVDVVLLDMVMPGIDGYAAARLIRSVPDAKELPIVAMTAKTGDDERDACLIAGCSDYLPKPVDKNALLELVDRLARPERGQSLRPPPRVSPQPPEPLRISLRAPAPAVAAPVAPQTPSRQPKRPLIMEPLDDDCAALVPAFLEKRCEELTVLEKALAGGAFDTVYRLGHNLRGSGGSYGFPTMTEIGERMEKAAKAQDGEAVAREIAELREHLGDVLRARGE